jgi:hypothetical protein
MRNKTIEELIQKHRARGVMMRVMSWVKDKKRPAICNKWNAYFEWRVADRRPITFSKP